MPVSVIIAPRARTDMREILGYLSDYAPSAALKLERQFRKAFSLLSKHPEIGHLRSDVTPKPLRFWSVGRYMVIYRENRNVLEIVRVLNAYRDITALL